MTDPSIVLSLEAVSKDRALKIAEEAAPYVWGFKVSDLIFHYGVEIVYELKQFGKVIADARLYGSCSEMTNHLRIFRNAGADIITVVTNVSVGEPSEDLASLDFKPDNPYGYHIIQNITAGEHLCDVFQANIVGPSLSVYGRSLLGPSDTLIKRLANLDEQPLG